MGVSHKLMWFGKRPYSTIEEIPIPFFQKVYSRFSYYGIFYFLQINVANKQLDSINAVVHKLEEKEKIYQTALGNLEKEMLIRQQALELHKRKAIENAQSAADLKLHLGNFTDVLSLFSTLWKLHSMIAITLLTPFYWFMHWTFQKNITRKWKKPSK